jgi:hypothetical protein
MKILPEGKIVDDDTIVEKLGMKFAYYLRQPAHEKLFAVIL